MENLTFYVSWKLLLIILFSVFTSRTEAMHIKHTTRYLLNDVTLVDVISQFSQKLMKNLVKADQMNGKTNNILFSPLSVASLLAILEVGASGETREEITKILFADSFGNENIKETFKNLRSSIMKPQKGEEAELELESVLFHDWSVKLRTDFLNKAISFYGVQSESVDFLHNFKNAQENINNWIRNRTRGMIQELLTPYDVTASTQLIIANVIFFRATWKYQFEKDKTVYDTFTTQNGNRIEVKMMRRSADFKHRKHCNAIGQMRGRSCATIPQPDVIEIPYANGDQAMIVLMENDIYSLEEIERNLSHDYAKWRYSVTSGEVVLTLPKFRMSFEIDLQHVLRSVGIKKMFQTGEANFQNMSEHNITLSKFIHEAHIKVDESGTLATSVSGVIGKIRSTFTGVHFKVDRSFIFIIEDLETGAWLFAGRIVDPTHLQINLGLMKIVE